MPKGNLSYKSMSACVASAKKAGVSSAPCNQHFKGKKGSGSSASVSSPGTGGNTGPGTIIDQGTPNYPGNPKSRKKNKQY